MFESIRVQILYPCRAHCAWCSTYRKNPLFGRLYRSGAAQRVHDLYVQAISFFRPRQVFVSGGEPLLYPEIASFLSSIADVTEQISVFTSYQYGAQERDRIPFAEMPLDKMVLCHTTIGFEPERWHELTGFPFVQYVDNVRAVAQVPVRKRVKFILNHPDLIQEVQRFQAGVGPDGQFEFGLKLVNDQGGGLNQCAIRETSTLARQRAQQVTSLIEEARQQGVHLQPGSLEQMAPVLDGGDVEQCPYRRSPLELRLALYKADERHQVLKYRYCPFFPSHFGYRYHVGRDDLERLAQNYQHGDFRKHCRECRFLAYASSSGMPETFGGGS